MRGEGGKASGSWLGKVCKRASVVECEENWWENEGLEALLQIPYPTGALTKTSKEFVVWNCHHHIILKLSGVALDA